MGRVRGSKRGSTAEDEPDFGSTRNCASDDPASSAGAYLRPDDVDRRAVPRPAPPAAAAELEPARQARSPSLRGSISRTHSARAAAALFAASRANACRCFDSAIASIFGVMAGFLADGLSTAYLGQQLD